MQLVAIIISYVNIDLEENGTAKSIESLLIIVCEYKF